MLLNIHRALESFRIYRVLMLSIVTASTAYGLGASFKNTFYAGLTGGLLSLAGFFMDNLFDFKKDKKSGQLSNPIAAGAISFYTGVCITVCALITAVIFTIIMTPFILIPLSCVILVIAGLGSGILDSPLGRAYSLGALQAFYVWIGALAAGNTGLAPLMLSLFLFFAMSGGKVLGDIRDLDFDKKAGLVTLPGKYGMGFSIKFLFFHEAASYLFGLAAFFTGKFSVYYLYCMIGIIITGSLINILFAFKKDPKTAKLANGLSLGFLGSLYILGMVFGRI